MTLNFYTLGVLYLVYSFLGCDASVKSVIRIRTKLPQGEGFGGTLRAQNGFRHYFSSMEQANLKYRTVLLNICEYLECDFGDIMEAVPENEV